MRKRKRERELTKIRHATGLSNPVCTDVHSPSLTRSLSLTHTHTALHTRVLAPDAVISLSVYLDIPLFLSLLAYMHTFLLSCAYSLSFSHLLHLSFSVMDYVRKRTLYRTFAKRDLQKKSRHVSLPSYTGVSTRMSTHQHTHTRCLRVNPCV